VVSRKRVWTVLWQAAAATLVAAAVSIGSDAGVSGAGSPGAGPVFHVPILLYHRIIPSGEAGNSLPALVVSPAEFAAQLDLLKAAGWHSITAARLADYLTTGVTPPDRSFVITIDDGTDDGYTQAFPILREHGFVASYYVVAGRIGHSHDLDADQLRALTAAGNEIGNHTMRHFRLARRAHAIVAGEIADASAAIAAITSHRPVTFAYPFGSWDASVAADVAACPGLRLALTTVRGSTETWAGRFELPRIAVGPATQATDLLAQMVRGS
jgi:peptidoglycan/xylan/chitin deacetylase (PgdA/CDA1 family)